MQTPFSAELIATANAIVAPGKGILAADESSGTIGKRFEAIAVENNEENRRAYRELLCTTPGLEQHVSGVLLYEESLFHKCADGTPFADVLRRKGIVIGIKVDMGTVPIAGTDGELETQGHTDLAKRCKKYYDAGARFAKWRAVITIKDSGCPSDLAIRTNVDGLSRYAAICQMNGLVPIVEPEILMDGPFGIEVSAAVTAKVLAMQYASLAAHHILLEGTLLKPNMVRPGEASGAPFDPVAIARATVRTLQQTLPVAVPGVTFLSGGMSEEDATLALDAINKFEAKKPWTLTFSYGRALQQSVLKAWKGKPENVAAAQQELIIRAKANGEAALGKYAGGAGGAAASASLHVKGYTY